MINIRWSQRPYIWLLLLSIVFLVSYVGSYLYFPENPHLQTWSGRLSASVFGAYLTAVVVDGTFREKERRRKENLRGTAFDELSSTLFDQKRLIEEMVKAATNQAPEEGEVETLKDLVDSEEFEQIRMLDIHATCPRTNRSQNYSYLDAIEVHHEELVKECNGVIKKYGFALEPEFVDLLQSLNSHKFMFITKGFKEIHDPDATPSPLLLEFGYEEFQKYLEIQSAICEYIGEGFDQHELNLLYSSQTTPMVGQGRIPDDLSVSEAVEKYKEVPAKEAD